MIIRLHRIFLSFLCLYSTSVFSQVVINEVCSANGTVIADPRGEFSDWIEIYNAGSTSVDISGYGITDDIADPYKFKFGTGTIGAGKYKVVFASGHKGFYAVDHWELAVDDDDDWRYFVGNSQPDTNWRNCSFNDNSWNHDEGGFGYGDGDDNTTIAHCSSVFMRTHFNVNDPSEIIRAVLSMDYDDGFVAFLNGVEIARANVGSPGTRPSYDYPATEDHEAQMYQGDDPDSFSIDPGLLKKLLVSGDNVLAIQVHNTSSSSNDLSAIAYLQFGMKTSSNTYRNLHSWFNTPSFEPYEAPYKLSSAGETLYLMDAAGNVIDQRVVGPMQGDHSCGHKPDGTGSWCVFKTPTPAKTNDAATSYTGYCAPPVFSHPSGYYSSTISLSASSNTSGATIRYTTDGSEPTTSSSSWSGNKSISSTKTVKARAYKSGYLPSDLVCATYFKNENFHLPVFSISTDPDNLFDYHTGIYELGPNADTVYPYKDANFWQDWERPARIEYFDKNKDRKLDFDANIAIYGNYSRAKPQKSFEIKLDKSTESGSLDYQLLPDKPFLTDFDNFVLRNSGTDWNRVHFKDAFLEKVMKNTYSGYLATEPVNVFINGDYWGVYNTYENHDQHFMSTNYGWKRDEIDYLLESTDITTKLGCDEDFMSLIDYATSANPNSSSYYNYINDHLDLQNFTDYMVAQTYFNNEDWMGDWTNNIKIWRPMGGKWKYLLYDLDATVGYAWPSPSKNSIDVARNPQSQNRTSDMFDELLTNPTYKNYFINRYADLINTIFQTDSLDVVRESIEDSMAFDMSQHFARWGGSVSGWHSEIHDMENYLDDRPDYMRSNIKNEFNLNSEVELTLKVSPAGAGRIQMNTVVPKSYPWDGIYFNGNPVTITAIPNPGYTFDHWKSTVSISSNNPNQTLTRNFSSDDIITAYFNGNSSSPSLVVSEFNFHSSDDLEAGDWIELHNNGTVDLDLSGFKITDEHNYNRFVFPVGTVLQADGYLVVAADPGSFHSAFPQVNNYTGPLGFELSNSGDSIHVLDYDDAQVLEVNFTDDAPWPDAADGDGYTCELLNASGNFSDGANWFAGCYGGSPGREYSSVNSQISAAGNTTFCPGGSVELEAFSDPDYSYQWLVDNTEIQGATSDSYDALQPGTYSVLVSSTGCMMESNGINVQMHASPFINLGSDTAIAPGETLLLDAGAGYATYTWSENSTSETIIATAGNNYWVTVEDIDGCTGSDSISISIETGLADINYLNGVKVYPNPVSALLNFSFPQPADSRTRVCLVDMQGRTLAVKEFNSAGLVQDHFDVSDFAKGIYLMTFRSGDGVRQLRITVQ